MESSSEGLRMPGTTDLNYDLLVPPRIVFGWGRRRELGAHASQLGRRAFVVTGSRTLERAGRVDELCNLLESAGVEAIRLASIGHEPLVADVNDAVRKLSDLRAERGDFLLGFGGGSAIDLAKAAAAMATNAQGGSVLDFLEGVGTGRSISVPPLPSIAMPTTGGTGTEATKNAVISSFDPPFKKSLRSDRMVPKLVLIDPELSTSVPPSTTATTGMDAITQLIESYICRRAKPIPQALALQGLELALDAVTEAYRNGASRSARERMAHAALLSGIALANSGLGMAHGVAAALGVHCGVPHGLACAVMLPVALHTNQEVAATPLAELGRRLCPNGHGKDPVEAMINRIDRICDDLSIPSRLSELGVRREQLPAIVSGSRGNSMSANPRELSDQELHSILESML